MMKKWNYVAICLVLILLTSNGISSIASAASDENQLKYDQVIKNMQEDGLSQSDIDKVISKLKNGEILDSEKNTESDLNSFTTNSNDISSESKLVVTDKNPVVIQKFEDGSYNKLELSIQPDISDLTTSSLVATTDSNIMPLYFQVKGSSPFGKASFNTSADINTHHLGSSTITGVSRPSISTLFGTFLNDKLLITRAKEVRSSRAPAQAHLEYKYTNSENLVSFTTYLEVSIGEHINDRYGIQVTMTRGNGSYE